MSQLLIRILSINCLSSTSPQRNGLSNPSSSQLLQTWFKFWGYAPGKWTFPLEITQSKRKIIWATLQETNISPKNGILSRWFSFSCLVGYVSIPWRVSSEKFFKESIYWVIHVIFLGVIPICYVSVSWTGVMLFGADTPEAHGVVIGWVKGGVVRSIWPGRLLGGGNWNIFHFHPFLGKMNPFWLSYFSDGLKPPTRLASWNLIVFPRKGKNHLHSTNLWFSVEGWVDMGPGKKKIAQPEASWKPPKKWNVRAKTERIWQAATCLEYMGTWDVQEYLGY